MVISVAGYTRVALHQKGSVIVNIMKITNYHSDELSRLVGLFNF